MKPKDKRILVISDLHIPYHHQDAFDFLKVVAMIKPLPREVYVIVA